MRWTDLPRNPDRKTLRHFGWFALLFFGLIFCYRWSQGTAGIGAWLLLGIGGLLATVATLYPQGLKPIFVGWMILVFPVGWLVSQVVLAFLFFGVFAPLGVFLRLLGHDPLLRRKPTKGSYWQDKDEQTNPRRYLQQF